ncbi:zinc finger protein 600-like [Culicoides brevitarsis]|uniref:zinc finger protein 600-like n=1 Tax=Culicoides brevitarsis TaxID=469753 RepID=UPI00307C94DD
MESEASSLMEIQSLDLNNLCRVCGLFNKILIQITSELQKKIESYLPIKVSETDICSKLCIHCTNALLNWDEIYENCIETDRKLKEIMTMSALASNDNNSEEEGDEAAESQGSEKELEIDLGMLDEPPEELRLTPNKLQEKEKNLSAQFDALKNSVDETPKKKVQKRTEEDVEMTKEVVVATDSNQNTLKCSYCTTVNIKSQQDLNDHYRQEHFDAVFHCEMCDNYLDRNDLMTHMISHALESATDSLKVAEPTQTTSKQPENSQVVNTNGHSSSLPMPSPSQMQVKTSTAPTAASPPAKQHGKENQLYCTVCQKHFNTRSGFAYHINQHHSKIKNYSCSFCDKKFGMKRILDNHIRNIHSSEKTFQCMKCFKYFKTDAALYNHEIIHKQSNYGCDLCDKKFHYKHNLEVHRLLHSNDRKYSCNHCSSTFKTRNYLAKHLKGHFSETKSFLCTHCDFKTTQKRYLSEHVKRKHSNSAIAVKKE